jgi:hypothetical protein
VSVGIIEVVIDGLETTYTPSCNCGWVGGETATVEWAEFSYVNHHVAAHQEATA